MQPIKLPDYSSVKPLEFLPTEEEFKAFLALSDDGISQVKRVLTKWFAECGVKQMADKSVAFAPHSSFFNALDANEWIDKVDAFQHIQVIMSDLVVKEDQLRMHLVMYFLKLWFTDESLSNYLS